MNKAEKSLRDRLWKRVNKSGPLPPNASHLGPCWVWTGSVNRSGYGAIGFSLNGQVTRHFVHRLVYTWLVGPIAEGLEIDHLCFVRTCVNPAHMEVVTRAENNRRMWRNPDHTGVANNKTNRPREMCYKNLHPLTGDNIFMDGLNRRCRECRNAAKRKAYRREK